MTIKEPVIGILLTLVGALGVGLGVVLSSSDSDDSALPETRVERIIEIRDRPGQRKQIADLLEERKKLRSELKYWMDQYNKCGLKYSKMKDQHNITKELVKLMDDPKLDDPVTGLSYSKQTMLKALCHSYNTVIVGSDGQIDNRNYATRALGYQSSVDRHLGKETREAVAKKLRAEAEKYGFDHAAYAARHPDRQKIYAYLCYPCERKVK